MTKAEKIKEAYGEYWELFPQILKDRILSNNGVLDYFILPREERCSTEKICDIRSGKSIFECTKTDEGTPRFFRPKILNGIDKNRGWIKIETQSDLPKESAEYWVVLKSGTISKASYLEQRKVFFMFGDLEVTHYQKMIYPGNPIY